MDFEQSLKYELSNISGLSGRIFPLDAPEGFKAPYLIYLITGIEREKELRGHTENISPVCEIMYYAKKYSEIKSMSKSIVTKIKSFQSRCIGSSGPYIQSIDIITQFEKYENEVGLYCGIVEFQACFEEI